MLSVTKTSLIAILMTSLSCLCVAQGPDKLLLKDYRPKSIYQIPVTKIGKAKFPAIDMHSHAFAKTKAEIEEWIVFLEKYNIEKTILLTGATGAKFDSLYEVYSKYGDRFQLWCGFDYTGYPAAGWSENAVKELDRCYRKGARGVGELGDKGLGELYSKPVPAYGMHIDDPRMRPLLLKCSELKMPVNIHVAEPKWMYEAMDSTNDGLMNAYEWRIPKNDVSMEDAAKNVKSLSHGELITTLENAVRDNPSTTFIACHFANCEYDLSILGKLMKKYPNLYADISARYAETAPVPRYMKEFYQQNQDRLLFGTDMSFNTIMYETVFRILQTADEHFYAIGLTGYHWPLQGFDLDDAILKKVYKANAEKLIQKK